MEGNCSYTMKDGEKVFLVSSMAEKWGLRQKGTAKMIGGYRKILWNRRAGLDWSGLLCVLSAEGITQSYNKAKIIIDCLR